LNPTSYNLNNMEKHKQKLLILLGVVGVGLVIAIIFTLQDKAPTSQTDPKTAGSQSGQVSQENAEVLDAAVSLDDEELIPVSTEGLAADAAVVLRDAVVVVPGANPITTDNKVVTLEGVVADSSARPMAENAPRQTGFLNKEELPASVVKIEIGNGKFSPSEFRTKAGAPTTFSLTGVDSYSNILAFEDPSLAAVAILVGPGQTKAITFNAPTEPGRYVFRNGSPDKTETGVMIVE